MSFKRILENNFIYRKESTYFTQKVEKLTFTLPHSSLLHFLNSNKTCFLKKKDISLKCSTFKFDTFSDGFNLKGKLSDSFTNYNYVGNTKVSVSIKKT